MTPDMRKSFVYTAVVKLGVGLLSATIAFTSIATSSVQQQTSAPTGAVATPNFSYKYSAHGKASAFGNADTNNIGVVIFNSLENGATPEQIGDYVKRKLNERLAVRISNNPSFTPSAVDIEYFVQKKRANSPEGIVVYFIIDGRGTGIRADIRLAVTDSVLDEVLDEVLDKRSTTAKPLSPQ